MDDHNGNPHHTKGFLIYVFENKIFHFISICSQLETWQLRGSFYHLLADNLVINVIATFDDELTDLLKGVVSHGVIEKIL